MLAALSKKARTRVELKDRLCELQFDVRVTHTFKEKTRWLCRHGLIRVASIVNRSIVYEITEDGEAALARFRKVFL